SSPHSLSLHDALPILAFAKQNPQAEITAVDWPNVLTVAKENAQFFGASDRYHTIPGSAFDVDYGTDYDIILLTNFLHHFDPPTRSEEHTSELQSPCNL